MKVLKRAGIVIGVLVLVFVAVVIILIVHAQSSGDSYAGGYAPDGTYCDYGYNLGTKECCDDDDYSCETYDERPFGATAFCEDGTYSFEKDLNRACVRDGGSGGSQSDFSLWKGSIQPLTLPSTLDFAPPAQ